MQFIGLSAWLAVAAAAATPTVAPPDAAGRWQGTIHVPGAEVEGAVDLARNDGGSWIGSMVAPALALPGTPVSALSVEGAQVRFALKGALGDPRFEGRLRKDGTLAGLFLLAATRLRSSSREPARRRSRRRRAARPWASSSKASGADVPSSWATRCSCVSLSATTRRERPR